MVTKMLKGVLIACLLLMISRLVVLGKDNKPDPFAKVDKVKVETAIKKGAGFLIKANDFTLSIPSPEAKELDAAELVLYTLIHAGVSQNEPFFKGLLEKVLAKPLERTYAVALLAMILQNLDSEKYQARIAECGQFLIDNQCKNGQWSYGQKIDLPAFKPTGTPTSDKPTDPNATRALKQIRLQKRKDGPPTGDNSNTQYACLGLRACMQAGVTIPPEVFARTERWLEQNQQGDGGWGYGHPQYAAGPGLRNEGSYGSMTTGALGSLIICKFYQRKDYKNDPKVNKGLNWITSNFTVKENPKAQPPDYWQYYYLYALERLGAFLESELFGKHEWYPTGAEYLLAAQEPMGGWQNSIDQTCFAILFLRRATKPLRAIITK